MIKKYLPLKKEQKKREVRFSSQFVGASNPIRHEITEKEYIKNPKEAEEKEVRLRNDKFFRNWGQDEDGKIVHEIRS